MRFCTECGGEIREGWKACPGCGTKLDLSGVCQKCGEALEPSWKVCPACQAGAVPETGVSNVEGVMQVKGDMAGGHVQKGDFRQAGGASVGGGITFNLAPQTPPGTYPEQPRACPACGRYKPRTETFRCLSCERDGLCLEHLDRREHVCTKCAHAKAGPAGRADVDASGPQRERVDYFPLEHGARYTYRWSFQGETGEYTEVAVKMAAGGTDLYCFLDSDDLEEDNPVVAQAGPGLHAFYVREGAEASVILPDSVCLADLDPAELPSRQPMLPDQLQEGATARVLSHDRAREAAFTIEALETVTVPAGRFEDCLRLRMRYTWLTGKYDDYWTVCWLAANVGKVKLQFSNGSVRELVSSSRT